MKNLRQLVIAGVLLVLAVILLTNLLLWMREADFIFKPKTYPQGNWHPVGPQPQEVWIAAPDGRKINGWYLPHQHPKAIILYLHGNAGNITDRYQEILKLHDTLDASVMIIDYPGYGKSQGVPEEKALIQAAELARAVLAQKASVSPQDIILLGRSLGTGVAVALAAHSGAKGVILISPFLSLADAVHDHYPILAARLVMHNQFDSMGKIPAYEGPLLVIHGVADEVIPISQGQALWSAARGPKQFVALGGVRHFDPLPDQAYQKIKQFIARLPIEASQKIKPIVILISIDGFRKAYLQQLKVPQLTQLAQDGVSAELLPVFPSVTFVNHYSIATGLYPEHHGILLNEFYAPDLKQYFTHQGHAPTANDPAWWKGEPIWVSAEKQGLLTASAFWPGTQARIAGFKPNYFQVYAEDSDPQIRAQQILHWLDLPSTKRPSLLMLYFENVDNAGHEFGPDADVVQEQAKRVDDALGSLIAGLKKRGLYQQVNIIIVSDHGMSSVDPTKVIDLLKYIKAQDLQAMTDHGAVMAIYPKPGKMAAVYQALKNAPEPMQVYRGAEIPAQYHYRFPGRTPPILCVAEEHAFILGSNRHIEKGIHGYDPRLEDMHGIFIAHGPAFKKGYSRPPFQNINIYALIAYLLHLRPAHTDGSLTTIEDVLIDSTGTDGR